MTSDVSGAPATAAIREYRADDLEAAYRLDQSCFEEGISYTRGQIRAFLAREGAIALRRGLGRRVFDELLGRMARAGARDVRLEVDTRNANALRFYERMGFKATRKLPDYYGWGLDGIRMTRKL